VLQKALNSSLYEDEGKIGFIPMVFFSIFNKGHNTQVSNLVNSLGLANFIYRDYRWTHRNISEIELEDVDLSHKIFFFFGEFLNLDDLNLIIKLFMNGASIIL